MTHKGMVVVATSLADAARYDLVGCCAVVTTRCIDGARGATGRAVLVTAAAIRHPQLHRMLDAVRPSLAFAR